MLQHLLVGNSCWRPPPHRSRLRGQQRRVVCSHAVGVRRRPGRRLQVQSEVAVDGLLEGDQEGRGRRRDLPSTDSEFRMTEVRAQRGVEDRLQHHNRALAPTVCVVAAVGRSPEGPELKAGRREECHFVDRLEGTSGNIDPVMVLQPLRVDVGRPRRLQAQPASDHRRRFPSLRLPPSKQRAHDNRPRKPQVAHAASQLRHSADPRGGHRPAPWAAERLRRREHHGRSGVRRPLLGWGGQRQRLRAGQAGGGAPPAR
mmetsp:Transcript_79064/g.235598  ORF Transcript_79064/g.235598 Transcript_79064/m.235598 type:complete len:257 (-) Transcript_79064:665-1435(-)